MAREIKAIKCPNCGSISKTEIKTDFYKCDACQTEYFLDDNDVNINHNYNHPKVDFTNNSKALKIIGIVFGSFIGLMLLINVFGAIFSSGSTDNNNSVYSTPSSHSEKDDTYSTNRYSNLTFLNPQTNEPIIVFNENRRYSSLENKIKEGTYLAFYNPKTKKLISEEKISEKSLSSSDLKFRTFSDGNIYVINDKTSFLKLNKETYKTENVGTKFFEANTDLQIGVATIEFVYDNYGDGLILLTNDGKKRYYYPLVQQLYEEKQWQVACKGFNNLSTKATSKEIFLFTSQSSDYPEENLQLIKLLYKDNGAGPKDVIDRLNWGKDYGGSGLFTDRDPYKKSLIDAWGKNSGRILNWKDFTPNRLYFSPSVILDESQYLVIQFRADANPKSGYKIQQIDRENGSILWTLDLQENQKFSELIAYKDGFAGVKERDELVLLDKTGKVTSTYKLE